MKKNPFFLACLSSLLPILTAHAQTVKTEKATSVQATTFVFPTIASNSSADLANGKAFTLLAGTQNAAGSLTNLTNGSAQIDSDEGPQSFFATDGSTVRIQVDLGSSYSLSQINTYSWHTGVRAPQFYKLYGATAPTNAAPNFTDAAFRDDSALATLGYQLIASVNTQALGGGQHAANITGTIGTYRYLIFEISRANTTNGIDGSRGTFFGEIDIYGVLPASTLELTGFTYDRATGNSEVSIKGGPSTSYILVEADDLDFSNPDQSPVPLTSATVGTINANQVTTDANGAATVQFNLGTTKPATFIRAQKN